MTVPLQPVYRFTDRRHGDLAVGGPPQLLVARRRTIVDLPWTWLRQVHGATVVTVSRPGGHAGAEADAAVTAVPSAALAVHTADCAPVVLMANGVVGVAHAGWRGLEAGVIEATVAAMRAAADVDGSIRAVLGPCIWPECYEFGTDDLDRLAERFGDEVRARTSSGMPALHVPAAVRAALAKVGVTDLEDPGGCTGCGDAWFSHRVRRDTARQAAVVWLEST